MKIIGKDRIDGFSRSHSLARKPLAAWVMKVEAASWQNSADIKATFPSVDNPAGHQYIFNIGGNKFRLVALVRIVNEVVVVQQVMTHAEYNKWSKERQKR